MGGWVDLVMIRYISLLLFIGLAFWGCEATFITEVTLWGVVYSVENTTELDLYNNQLTGSIPPEIGNLTNLTGLGLHDNQLTGDIPNIICNLDIEWSSNLNITNNQLCPPYPSCIEDYVGEQDTTNCN